MGIADELITRGWTQSRTLADDGRVCLVGAARLACGLEPSAGAWDWSLPDRVREALWACDGVRERLVNDHPCAWAWNDDGGRTFDEVLRVAKEADEILDAQS